MFDDCLCRNGMDDMNSNKWPDWMKKKYRDVVWERHIRAALILLVIGWMAWKILNMRVPL